MRRRDSLGLCLALGAASVTGGWLGRAEAGQVAGDTARAGSGGPEGTAPVAGAPGQDAPGQAAPDGAAAPVVLRVGGLIDLPPHGEAGFTLAALEALGMRRLRTTTPWTRGVQEFGGVTLASLMQAVRPRGARLRLEAINLFRAELPLEDAWQRGAFLATRQDGAPMRIRDRGPVWLIYPWSARPELDISTYHERAVWQLRRIEVV